MAHAEQQAFCRSMRVRFGSYFKGKKVVDLGSLDINGCNRPLFEVCDYAGVDIADGSNVDVVCKTHEFPSLDASFDVVISTEALEHDMFYEQSLKTMVHLLKPGGLMVFTCATTGRQEHGTRRYCSWTSPLTSRIDGWADYYRNVTEEDVREVINCDQSFVEYEFIVDDRVHDL